MYRARCVEITHSEGIGEWVVLERLHDRHRGHTRWYIKDRDAAHRHFDAVEQAHRCQ